MNKMLGLLTDSSRWTQGAMARDRNGEEVSTTDPGAVSFCLLGAVLRCYGDEEERYHVMRQLIKALNLQSPVDGTWAHNDLAWWNDDPARTFADVRTLIETPDTLCNEW